MKWSNLKLNKCPKCNGPLAYHSAIKTLRCPKQPWHFQIPEARAKEIIAGLVVQQLDAQRPARGNFDEGFG